MQHDLIKRIKSFDDFIKEKIITTKTMIYNLVDQAFLDLEGSLKTAFYQMHEEIGIYSMRKS